MAQDLTLINEESATICDPRSAMGSLKVLHLNAGNMYGGVETILTTLAALRGLCPGMDPQFAACFEGRYSRELLAAGVRLHRLGEARISRPWTVWRARRRLRQILESEKFDLVFCHMAWTLVLFGGVARAAGNRVVLWAHGFQDRKNWLERLASRMRPDLAIANSRFTAAAVHQHFPKTRVEVLYCPVELRGFFGAPEWRDSLRSELGAGRETTVILQAGRLEPWKGHLLHLEALSRIPQKNWICWIAGGAQSSEQQAYLAQLQTAAGQLGIAGRVRFLGQRADVPKLMAAADIFCQPNQGPEPFGIVFIEALSAGCPVITSGLGGAIEIVNESCGLQVPPGDRDLLAESLVRLIDSPDLRRRLGCAGPARARQLCDPESQMRKLQTLAQSVVETRSRR